MAEESKGNLFNRLTRLFRSGPVVKRNVLSQADNKTKSLQSEVEELKKERVQLTKQKAEQELLRLHPDFMTIKSDEDLRIAFDCGASQITGGSIAIKNPDLFRFFFAKN